MARSADPNSAGSQFFICLGTASSLDRQYTAFGKLIKGLDVLDKIGDTPVTRSNGGEQSKPTTRVALESVKIVPADSVKASTSPANTCLTKAPGSPPIQMQCGPEPEANLEKAVARVREAAGARRADHLPAGAFPLAIFLPVGRPRIFRARRSDPRALDGGVRRGRARDRRGHHRVALRETRRRPLPQHRRDHRRRWRAARQVSQDAHPG